MKAGAGGGDLVIACGGVRVAVGAAGLFEHLARPLVETVEPATFGDALRVLVTELAAPRLGTRALIETTLEQCLVVVLRRQLEAGATAASWLPALADARLARALALMLERPSEHLTLDQLAAAAGMSRSAFSEGFAAVLGRSPMDFLNQVRLRRAAHLLEYTDLPIEAVAASVGYASRSHFSRAFRRHYGVDPTRYRSTHLTGEAAAGKDAASV